MPPYADKIYRWFNGLPDAFRNDSVGEDRIKYQFHVRVPGESVAQDDGHILRNVVIENAGCRVTETLDDEDADVQIHVDEADLNDIIDGRLSLFDAFLISKVVVKGRMKHASRLMDFFAPSVFPNRRLDHLSVENVFNNIDKMVDRIPRKLVGKNLYFKVTGKSTNYYFLKIDDTTVRRVPREEVTVAHAKITVPETVLLGMFCGEVNYMEAYDNGDIGFNGENQLGIDFDRMFDYRFTR